MISIRRHVGTSQEAHRNDGRFTGTIRSALAGAVLGLAWIGTDSTCETRDEADGKVSYTRLARSLVRFPNNPAIKVGEKGAWDDQTFPDGIHGEKTEKTPLVPRSVPHAITVGDTFRLHHPGG